MRFLSRAELNDKLLTLYFIHFLLQSVSDLNSDDFLSDSCLDDVVAFVVLLMLQNAHTSE